MSIADISGSKKSSASPTHFSLHQCLNKQDFLTILSKPESLPTHLLPRVSIFHISFVPSSGVPLLGFCGPFQTPPLYSEFVFPNLSGTKISLNSKALVQHVRVPGFDLQSCQETSQDSQNGFVVI